MTRAVARTPATGFTLVEILLSVMILTMLIGLSLPVYETFARRDDLDLTVQQTASLIRRGETYARASNGDSTWGVAVQTGSIVLYKGASYASRVNAFDEAVVIPGSVSLSGLTEINFAKLTGLPSTTGTVTFSGTTNDSRTLNVNAKGVVEY